MPLSFAYQEKRPGGAIWGAPMFKTPCMPGKPRPEADADNDCTRLLVYEGSSAPVEISVVYFAASDVSLLLPPSCSKPDLIEFSFSFVLGSSNCCY